MKNACGGSRNELINNLWNAKSKIKLFSSSDPTVASLHARSEVQECAIAVGLLMFGIILERFIEVLKESLNIGAPVVILGEARKAADK